MQTNVKTHKTAVKRAFLAGISLCAILAATFAAPAQGQGARRPAGAIPQRSAALASGQAQNGTAYGQTASAATGYGQIGSTLGVTAGRANGALSTPLLMGTIVAGDASTGRILIQAVNGSSQQVVQISNSTQFVTLTPTTASNLQVGDQVRIRGVAASATATTITANTITAGQIPDFLQTNRQPVAVGGAMRSAPASSTSNASSTSSASTTTPVLLTGQITTVSPLTVTLNNGVSVTVTTSAQAQVNRVTSLLFRNLQVGDRLMATGQVLSNGLFVATGVAINM